MPKKVKSAEKQHAPQPPLAIEIVHVQPLRVTIPQAAQALAISPTQVYRRLQSGELKGHKDGVSTYIMIEELRRYAASRTELQLPDPQVKRMAIETATKRMETRARKQAAAGA